MWTGIWCTCTSFWENRISILRKFIVPAAKLVGFDFLDNAASEIAEFVGCRKNIKTAAKSVGRQTLCKQLCGGSKKEPQEEAFRDNLQTNQLVAKTRFAKHSSLTMLSNFQSQLFGGVRKPWRRSPSS